MSYSYVKYNANSGVQRDAKPVVISAVVVSFIALAYAVLTIINSGYMMQSPYSNISTRTVHNAVATVPTPQPSSPDQTSSNPVARPIAAQSNIGMNSVAQPQPAAPQDSAVTPAPVVVVTPVVPETIPSTPVEPTPGGGMGGGETPVVTPPEIEVPCLCEVVNGVVDTVTGLVTIP